MIEKEIRDFLVENLDCLSVSNCFIGNVPENPPAIYCVVKSQPSPLSDTHNSISEKLTTPSGINQKSVSLVTEVVGETYEAASTLIGEIFTALGGDDGGFIVHSTAQMYITPVESPFYKEGNLFKFNFIVRTNS